MNCAFHPNVQAVGKCPRCAKPLCASVSAGGHDFCACSAVCRRRGRRELGRRDPRRDADWLRGDNSPGDGLRLCLSHGVAVVGPHPIGPASRAQKERSSMNCAFHPQSPSPAMTSGGRALCGACVAAPGRPAAVRPASRRRVPPRSGRPARRPRGRCLRPDDRGGGCRGHLHRAGDARGAPSPVDHPSAPSAGPSSGGGRLRAGEEQPAPSAVDLTVPGQAAARAFAHSRKPDWAVTIPYHTEDLALGPCRDRAGARRLEDLPRYRVGRRRGGLLSSM